MASIFVEILNFKIDTNITITQLALIKDKNYLDNFYFPIQIVKLNRNPLSIKGSIEFANCWATTGQQNLLKQVKPQHKEEKI
jgi:hypothetical protein